MSMFRDFAVSLTYPPTLTLTLLALAALLWLLRRRRLGAGVAVAALFWSALWSFPFASDTLRGLLENRYPVVRDAARLPSADAIVVLGGGSHYAWLERPDVRPEDLRYSRLAAGARAWQAGRAPIVILSGGGEGGTTEARRMADAIVHLGVPRSALVLEERSRNTRDNARYSLPLAGTAHPRLLLVTSTLHMPRAALLFRQAGAQVTPMPVPEGRAPRRWWRYWLPSPRALWRSGRAFKEIVALTAAHLRL